MTTKRNFVSDAISIFFGSASGSLANLIIGMILVRHFADKSIYATYSQSMFLAETLVAFVPLGMHRAIIYFYPRVENKKAFTLQTILITSLLIFVFGIVFIVFRAQVGIWFNNVELTMLIPIILIIIWTLNFHSILLQILISTQRSRLAGMLLFAFNIIYVASVVIGVTLDFNVQQILLTIMLNHLIKTILTFIFVFGLPGNISEIRKLHYVWEQIKYSLPLGISSFTGMINKTADRFVIMTIFSPAVYAVYDRGAITIPFIEHVPYSISSVIQPALTQYFQEGKISEFIELWHQSIIKASKVMIPIMVFAWVAAKYIIIFVSTDAYLNSVQYFRIYLLLILFNLTLYPAILMAIGHTVKILKVSILYVLVNISMSVVLVMVFKLGPIGPAIATVLTEFIKMQFYLISIAKSLGKKYSKVYPWRKLSKTFLLALFIGVLIYPATLIDIKIVSHMMIDLNSLFVVMLLFCLYFPLFIFLGLRVKLITSNEILYAKEIFRLKRK